MLASTYETEKTWALGEGGVCAGVHSCLHDAGLGQGHWHQRVILIWSPVLLSGHPPRTQAEPPEKPKVREYSNWF